MKNKNLEVLPLALVGLAGGIYKYYVRDVIADGFNKWLESHIISQEELDKYIGEIASHDK